MVVGGRRWGLLTVPLEDTDNVAVESKVKRVGDYVSTLEQSLNGNIIFILINQSSTATENDRRQRRPRKYLEPFCRSSDGF